MWLFQSQTSSSEKLAFASARLLAKLLLKWVFDLEVNSIRSANLEVGQRCDNQFVFSVVARGKTHEYIHH